MNLCALDWMRHKTWNIHNGNQHKDTGSKLNFLTFRLCICACWNQISHIHTSKTATGYFTNWQANLVGLSEYLSNSLLSISTISAVQSAVLGKFYILIAINGFWVWLYSFCNSYGTESRCVIAKKNVVTQNQACRLIIICLILESSIPGISCSLNHKIYVFLKR